MPSSTAASLSGTQALFTTYPSLTPYLAPRKSSLAMKANQTQPWIPGPNCCYLHQRMVRFVYGRWSLGAVCVCTSPTMDLHSEHSGAPMGTTFSAEGTIRLLEYGCKIM